MGMRKIIRESLQEFFDESDEPMGTAIYLAKFASLAVLTFAALAWVAFKVWSGDGF
jgi:hypothetical protein